MLKWTKIFVLLFWMVSFSFANWLGEASKPQNTKTIDGKEFFWINSPEELAWFAGQVNSGISDINAVLGDDIVFGVDEKTKSTQNWTPIGKDSTHSFAGIFDGNGHTIFGLNVYGFEVGLFGFIAENGIVKNMKMTTGRVDGISCAGGIVAINSGTIQNVVIQLDTVYAGNFSATCAGGIAGDNRGIIKECDNSSFIYSYAWEDDSPELVTSSRSYAGGISGSNSGGILDCNNSGHVKSKSFSSDTIPGGVNFQSYAIAYAYAGGITGLNSNVVRDCFNSGYINADPYSRAFNWQPGKHDSTDAVAQVFVRSGGIVGMTYNEVSRCINDGEVTSSGFIISRYRTSDGNGYKDGAKLFEDYVGGIAGATGKYGYSYLRDCINNSRNVYTAKKLVGDGSAAYSYDIFHKTYWNGSGNEIKKSEESMKSDQFAWILNTGNGSVKNRGVWTRGLDGYPVFANGDSLAIYRVAFNNEGTKTYRYTNYKGYVEFPENPEPAENYVFSGWHNQEKEKVWRSTVFLADQTVDASYTEISGTYWNIRFFNADSTLFDTLVVAQQGVIDPKGMVPSQPATAKYSYSFVGWNEEPTIATEDYDYYAVYDSTINSYNVEFLDYDGRELQTISYQYGSIPNIQEKLTRNSTDEWVYSHVSWSPEIDSVVGDAIYTAVYDSTKRKYLVLFVDELGVEFFKDSVAYGEIPSFPDAPVKSPSVQYIWEFSGWNPTPSAVTENSAYQPIYTIKTRSYDIKFVDENDSLIQVVSAKYGSYPNVPDSPTKASSVQYTYKFAGWLPEIEYVKGEAIYKAVYDSVLNSYRVTFRDYKSAFKPQTVYYGESAVAPVVPEREGYKFIGWDKSYENVQSNLTINALYEKLDSSSSVTESCSSVSDVESSSSSMNVSSSSEMDEAIVNVALNPRLSVNVVGRNIQISLAKVGSEYALMDMQGRVMKRGRVNSANFNIMIPSAGTFVIRVENQVRRVNVR